MTDEPDSTENEAGSPFDDPANRAHPQPLYKMMRDLAPVVEVEMSNLPSILVSTHEDVMNVLQNPEIFSSNDDAVSIGQIRPLVPLQIDPPEHSKYRKLTDPLFAPKKIATMEAATRELAAGLVDQVVDAGAVNFHTAFAEPIPSTVFLQILGLPVERTAEFLALKEGIIRPPATTREERLEMTHETGSKIYAIFDELIAERRAEPQDDIISGFLEAEVDGHRLTAEDVLDIGYLFFLAGLDTVTASLDCMLAFLASHPEHRQQIVDDPSLIPAAIEELLRWETPVSGVARIAMQDTELAGCPIAKGMPVRPMLGSANTDESFFEDSDVVDFHRASNKHIAFGAGVHRCLGSHLARMELRVVLEEWHRRIPHYRVADGIELDYSAGIRQIENLELVW